MRIKSIKYSNFRNYEKEGNHFHQLNDSCDYSNEKNKAQEAEVNAFNDCVGSQHLGLQ